MYRKSNYYYKLYTLELWYKVPSLYWKRACYFMLLQTVEAVLASNTFAHHWTKPQQSLQKRMQSKCHRSLRICTWAQPGWDHPSDSSRRGKSSCRCLQDDRPWWLESTGRTGDACRLCNVCTEESQICDTDRDEEGKQGVNKEEMIKRKVKNTSTFPHFYNHLLCMDRNVCFL